MFYVYVLLITHMMDFRWFHGLIEHKDSVTTAKISVYVKLCPEPLSSAGYLTSEAKQTSDTSDMHPLCGY